MILQVEINRDYLEKALEYAAGAATRASNAKGINPAIRALHQQDCKLYEAALKSIVEVPAAKK